MSERLRESLRRDSVVGLGLFDVAQSYNRHAYAARRIVLLAVIDVAYRSLRPLMNYPG